MYLIGIEFAQVKSVELYRVELFEADATSFQLIYTRNFEEKQGKGDKKYAISSVRFEVPILFKTENAYQIVISDANDQETKRFGKGRMYNGDGVIWTSVNDQMHSLEGIRDADNQCSSKVKKLFFYPAP